MGNKSNEHPAVPFLKSFYTHCEEGSINLRILPSKGNIFIPVSKIDSIPKILEANRGQNVYFGIATRAEGNGSKNGILKIPGLWTDLDVYKLSDEQKVVSRQRYKEFPLKSSYIIDSGGGRYLLWRLKEPASKEDIFRVESLLNRLAAHFHGDSASTDASRILRVPGSLNHKYQHTPQVVVKESYPEREYALDDFDSLLPKVEGRSSATKEPINRAEVVQDVMECVFLKHCDKDRATLPEPEWYAMISNVARVTGGPDLIHNLSQGYPKYEPRETDSKILQAINASNPHTCQHIKSLWDCGKNCGVKSPAALGFKRARQDFNGGPEGKNSRDHHFNIVQARDIVSSPVPETEWIWDGILPAGGLSLVVAKPKVGKTTLAFNLALAISRGETSLGRKTQQANVVYLALEEKKGEIQKSLVKRRVIDEPLYFHFGPAPAEAMKEVGALITEKGAGLLVIDILQKFCRVKDLNDYSQVTRALEPLMATARQLNCHILLVHHAGKRDRDDGDDILGSTGLLGGVDTSIHLKRRDKTRRTFFTIQRYGEDIPETVIILQPDGSLEARGGREEVEIEETIPLILEALEEGSLIEREIWEKIEKGHSLVSKGLRKLVEQKVIKRTGTGKKGNPYVYEKDSLLLSSVYMEESRREFETEDNALKLNTNCSPNDMRENEPFEERMGRAFSPPCSTESEDINLLEGEI